jgi:hypothetical protein
VRATPAIARPDGKDEILTRTCMACLFAVRCVRFAALPSGAESGHLPEPPYAVLAPAGAVCLRGLCACGGAFGAAMPRSLFPRPRRHDAA